MTDSAVRYDTRLIQRGARLRRSPFFEATQAAGCRAYTVYNHMLLPSYYDDPVAEYWHLLEHVALWDVSVERQVEITGPDAYRFTSLLTPRDISRVRPGRGRYVLITADDGGIVNDPVLLRLGEDHFWLALADSDVLLWAKALALTSAMRVEIREPDVSPLQVQGPKSKEVMRALFDDRVEGLAYYHFFDTKLDGIPLIVTRTGWTGELGYEIYLRDGSRGLDLWERVMSAGKPYSIRPTGPSDIRRIEAGILNYGADMTLETNPFEVGLDRLVDLDREDDFIGRAALRRIKSAGPRRRLVGVEISGDPLTLNETFWPVRRAAAPQGLPDVAGGPAAPIGRVTSAVYSPRLERNIGYALVPAMDAGTGTRLLIDTPRAPSEAAIVPMPFVDPEKTIPRAG